MRERRVVVADERKHLLLAPARHRLGHLSALEREDGIAFGRAAIANGRGLGAALALLLLALGSRRCRCRCRCRYRCRRRRRSGRDGPGEGREGRGAIRRRRLRCGRRCRSGGARGRRAAVIPQKPVIFLLHGRRGFGRRWQRRSRWRGGERGWRCEAARRRFGLHKRRGVAPYRAGRHLGCARLHSLALDGRVGLAELALPLLLLLDLLKRERAHIPAAGLHLGCSPSPRRLCRLRRRRGAIDAPRNIVRTRRILELRKRPPVLLAAHLGGARPLAAPLAHLPVESIAVIESAVEGRTLRCTQ
mmetsp:Transcript_50169/g.115795  ORF Transcript_50169/g.115795 Transcript_50169/m.115795 type:complete len:303 (+) Transcript_50169:678-1586(+)